MCDTMLYIAVALVGALTGVIGHISEAGPITMRSSVGAGTTGSALGLIAYMLMISFYPDKIALAFAISAFIGLTRWNSVSPLCNCVLKVIYSLIFIITQKKIK